MSGTYNGSYNGSYSAIVTLGATGGNVTIGPTAVIDAYGLAGSYALDIDGTVSQGTVHAALFGPRGTVFTITNQGLVESLETGGTSTADEGIGLGTPGTLLNTGTVLGATGLGMFGTGLAGYVNNTGRIAGSIGAGIYLAAGSITNSGTVAGAPAGAAGIFLPQGGSVTNAAPGLITGGYGIYAAGAPAYVRNAGTIRAAASAGIALRAGGTVVNAGTIEGGTGHDAVYFGAGAARLVIEAGSVLDGGAVAARAAAATLELGEAGGGASFDMGGTVNGFDAITFDAGQDWSLEGGITELGGIFTGITGFASGDTIILDGFTASSATFAGGVLDLYNARGTIEQLALVGPYSAGQFNVAGVAQGTAITLCFARGTRILTPTGERAVEDLRPGNAVVCWRAGIARLKWVGYQSFAAPFLARDPERLPVRIMAGALGDNMPRRDLWVSPGHAVLLEGALVLARDLVNGITVRQDEAPALVEYFALELERHDCVLAEGVFAESFADGPGLRGQFHNAAAFHAAFPDYEAPAALRLCAPRPLAGAALEKLVRPVAARAAARITPGRLRGYVDIMEVGGHMEGWAQDLDHPELPVLLEIRLGGTLVATTLACFYRADLRQAGIGKGRAKFSFDAPPGSTVHFAATGAMLPLTDACRKRPAG